MPRVEKPVTIYEEVINFYEMLPTEKERDRLAAAIFRWLSGDDSDGLLAYFNESPGNRLILKKLQAAVKYTPKKKKKAELPEGYVDPTSAS